MILLFPYISKIETLGYKQITDLEYMVIKDLLTTFKIAYSNERIAEEAINIRRRYNLKTPDSLIAATARYLDIPLVTGDKRLIGIDKVDTIEFQIP